MKKYYIDDFKHIFKSFTGFKKGDVTKSRAYNFVKLMCVRDDVYRLHPNVGFLVIYIKSPDEKVICIDIEEGYSIVKLEFVKSVINYAVYDRFHEICERNCDECGSVKWNGTKIPDVLYKILYKNPVKIIFEDVCDNLIDALTNTSKAQNKWRQDESLRPDFENWDFQDDIRSIQKALSHFYYQAHNLKDLPQIKFKE